VVGRRFGVWWRITGAVVFALLAAFAFVVGNAVPGGTVPFASLGSAPRSQSGRASR
jgi:hypothetical protein